MFLLHAHNFMGYLIFLLAQSCQLPIHRPNKGMRQKNVLHAWNKITHRAGILLLDAMTTVGPELLAFFILI